MSDYSQVIRLTVYSCLIGFVVFCASYSYVVWRRRNKAAGNAAGAKYRSWFVTVAVFGLIGMALAFAIREAVSSEGQVVTEGFTVARAGEDMTVTEVRPQGDVKAGDVLVRFKSPTVEGELSNKKVALQRHEEQLAALALLPLEVDPELQRRHNLANSDKRTNQDGLDSLLSSHNTAVRELAQQVSTREDSLAKLEGEMVVVLGEIKQAEVKHRLAREQLERDLSARVGVIPLNEINDRQEKVATLATELVKLQGRRTNLETQRKQMSDMIAHFKALTVKENASFLVESERYKTNLAKAERELSVLEAQLNGDDKQRAEKKRDSDRKQLALKADEIRSEMVGLQNRLVVRAAHDGRVFYAHPSGASAPQNAPIVVAGPSDGFRFRVKMTEAQAEAMQGADEVLLDVGDGQLARKFAAKYRTKFDLPGEPGSVIAELEATNPPAEAVKVMAEETKMKARLTWKFPLMTFWPFRIGLLLLAVGIGGLMLTSALSGGASAAKPTPSSPSIKIPTKAEATPMKLPVNDVLVPLPVQAETFEPIYPEAIPVEEPSETVIASDVRDLVRKDPIVVHSAESGALLELLAIRLRESIYREQLEMDLVESAEWAVEHHGQRALRVFRQVFRQDNRYVPHMEELLERLESSTFEDSPTVVQQRDLTRRTARILELIGHRFLNPVAIA